MVTDMEKFKQFSVINAIGTPGTGLNQGVHEAAMLGMVMNSVQNTQQNNPPATNDHKDENDIPSRLKKLKDLFDGGLIDEQEYKSKKAELIEKL